MLGCFGIDYRLLATIGKMQTPSPITQDLVLIGGGHSHAIVLQMWGMKPIPGVRLTLISDGSDTPYSGMLPGYVAGFYSREECHIDLRSLCQFAGAQFYHDRAIGLDLTQQQVICQNHPPVGFDLLSIDIGSTPMTPHIGENMIPAKPVPEFLRWWEDLCQQSLDRLSLGIVGGGVGGVELAINMQKRLEPLVAQLELHLFSRSSQLLPQNNPWLQHRFHQLLQQREIQLHLGEVVQSYEQQIVHCQSGLQIPCETTVWVTQATAPDWLRRSGLAVDDRGFIQVDEGLRSLSHPQVFAAGDIAAMVVHPRPKAGVFAVRQGKPLFQNLQAVLLNQSLVEYKPQKQYLSLIGTADSSAIASRRGLAWEGEWVWQWKDRIDRQFMARFQNLTMAQTSEALPTSPPTLYCAGCGAKVGSTTLSRVLDRIPQTPHDSVVLGLEQPDDAAVLQVPAGKVLVQTIDYFPALLDDPFIFGQIAANHSLSDLFAMGADAQTVLAMATIPHGTETKQEETLFQLLSGAIKTLSITQTQLVGGHTIAGEKLAFGLSCNGFADSDRLLHKSGMQVGDCLILTKPLGTGVIFAGQMRQLSKPQWIDGAIATMLQSNYAAAQIFLHQGATACTDVTGFGLLGHLVEMVKASQVSVELVLDAMPFLAGAIALTEQAVRSSLYAQNARAQSWVSNFEQTTHLQILPLLCDPQTAGGLLATVPSDRVNDCLRALQQAGYGWSCVIGVVRDKSKPGQVAYI
jgi:selenide, water dikinase